jgi:hypothetical protein
MLLLQTPSNCGGRGEGTLASLLDRHRDGLKDVQGLASTPLLEFFRHRPVFLLLGWVLS